MDIHQKIGKTLRTLRLSKGLSQEKFAFEIGIDRSYVSDIENGSRNISVDMLDKIAQFHGLKISELFIKIEENE